MVLGRVWRAVKANTLDLFRASPDEFEALNGVRAICCIWIVMFHVLYLISTFQTKAQYYPLTEHWSMSIIRFGFSCVDVFFVLTGFLLSYPYFLKEFKLNKSRKSVQPVPPAASPTAAADASASASAGPDTGVAAANVTAFRFTYDTSAFKSVRARDYWYKRFVVRIWPPLIVALIIHCQILYPGGVLFPYSLYPTDTIYEFTKRWIPEPGTVQNNSCWLSVANLLFLNNQLPFGGCMGWTWSLAIQGQFYFALPLLLKLTGRARNLLYVCFFALLCNIAARALAVQEHFKYLQDAPPMAVDNVADMERYLVWFTHFYSPTANRLGAIVIGMLASYVQARVAVNDASESRCVRAVNWYRRMPLPLHAVVFAAAFYSLSRHKDWEKSYFYLVFEFIGGPFFNAAFAYVVLIAVNNISAIGAGVNWFLSMRMWIPISKISYSVYLLHCAVILKGFATVFYPAPDNIRFLWFSIAFNVGAVVALCAFLYVFIEKPITDFLAPAKAAPAKPTAKAA